MISTDNKTAVYNSPGGKKINLIDDCALKVTDVQNEWAEIKPAENIVGNEKYKGIKGWIKWRDNDTIKVRIIVRTID